MTGKGSKKKSTKKDKEKSVRKEKPVENTEETKAAPAKKEVEVKEAEVELPPVPHPKKRKPVSTWQKPEILGLGFGLCSLGLAIVIVYYSYIIEKGVDWSVAHFGTEFYHFSVLGIFLMVTGSLFLGMYFATPKEFL